MALQMVRHTGNQPVPLHLRNAPTQLMAELGYSDGYKYPHDYPGHYVAQQYMPDAMKDTVFFHPAETDKVQRKTDNNK
jgi:putative ATPase